MKFTLAIATLALAPLASQCTDLKPLKDARLATVLALSEEITPKPLPPGQPLFVRVYAAPDVIGECGGSVASCPSVRLFIAVSTGDLGETPTLYELPAAKGWEFGGWDRPAASDSQAKVGFTIQTALPESNIDEAARKTWRSTACHVLVGPAAATYVCQ